MSETNLPVVFIIGSKRSGTTWATWLLTQHPSIVAVFHSELFLRLRNIETWWQTEIPTTKDIIDGDTSKRKGSDPDESLKQLNIRDIVTEDDMYGYCRALSHSVNETVLASKPGASVVLEDTPENLECIEFALKVYPQAHVLHLVRDPRSVFASWKHAASTWSDSSIFYTNVARFSRRWHLDISRAREAADLTDRYREVRYEALLEDAVTELGDIFDWLGLPADQQLCEAAVEACAIGNLRKQATMPGMQGFFNKGLKAGWRDELATSEIRTVEYLAGDLMVSLGYERAYPESQSKPFRLWLQDSIAATLRGLKRALKAIGLGALISRIERLMS